jgi:hypothetical protein
VFAKLRRTLKVLLCLTLLLSAYVAWAGLTDRELAWPVSAVLGDKQVTGTDADFRDLRLREDPGSAFDGSLTVENPTSQYQDVFVTVDVFDGDQNVGELSGSVTLKPHSASTVDLTSLDRYVRWTDAHVDLLRTPS